MLGVLFLLPLVDVVDMVMVAILAMVTFMSMPSLGRLCPHILNKILPLISSSCISGSMYDVVLASVGDVSMLWYVWDTIVGAFVVPAQDVDTTVPYNASIPSGSHYFNASVLLMNNTMVATNVQPSTYGIHMSSSSMITLARNLQLLGVAAYAHATSWKETGVCLESSSLLTDTSLSWVMTSPEKRFDIIIDESMMAWVLASIMIWLVVMVMAFTLMAILLYRCWGTTTTTTTFSTLLYHHPHQGTGKTVCITDKKPKVSCWEMFLLLPLPPFLFIMK